MFRRKIVSKKIKNTKGSEAIYWVKLYSHPWRATTNRGQPTRCIQNCLDRVRYIRRFLLYFLCHQNMVWHKNGIFVPLNKFYGPKSLYRTFKTPFCLLKLENSFDFRYNVCFSPHTKEASDLVQRLP